MSQDPTIRRSRFQAWVLASRPRTLTAAAAPVFLGSGLAEGRGVFSLYPALAALVAALLIQVGTNLANDYYDHLRGGDREDRVGPLRVTQAGLIPPSAVRNAAYLVLGLALILVPLLGIIRKPAIHSICHKIEKCVCESLIWKTKKSPPNSTISDLPICFSQSLAFQNIFWMLQPQSTRTM